MDITTKCTKCGAVIRLQFGEISKEQALEAAEQLDRIGGQCPGGHVELGGLAALWQVRDAIHRAYDLGEGEAPQRVLTDMEHVERLMAEGKEVIDGGTNTVPELELPRIHDFPGLKHLGFGDFVDNAYSFIRADSPRGTRFYVRERITG